MLGCAPTLPVLRRGRPSAGDRFRTKPHVHPPSRIRPALFDFVWPAARISGRDEPAALLIDHLARPSGRAARSSEVIVHDRAVIVSEAVLR